MKTILGLVHLVESSNTATLVSAERRVSHNDLPYVDMLNVLRDISSLLVIPGKFHEII